ncbi:MAG: hypothetical protein IJ518_03545 [Clostridia bacterium]|nr:hypothetical protein [Clostridia bacterium]
MKKHLRSLSLVLAVVLALGLMSGLTACKPEDKPTVVDTRYKKFDPPITLTTTRTAASADQLDAWKQNPYIVWCEEKLGIIWEPKYVAASNDDHIRQLTLLANSNDLPDVLADGSDIFPELYQGGYLRVVEDDINEHGSAMVKHIFNEYKTTLGLDGVANKINEDGKLYCIPHVLDPTEAGAYETLYIRMDIVEELGYDKPTTIAELEEVMAAYKKAYPQYYPYLTESVTYGTSSMVFAMHGAYAGWYYPKADGKYTYGSIEPAMKEALATLNSWYKKGWMDPYYYKQNSSDYQTAFINGKGLLTGGMGWFSNWSQTQLSLNLEEARVEPLGFLAGPKGNADYDYYTWLPTGWPAAISTNCQHPEAVITELNELYESVMRNDTEMREKFGNKYPITAVQEPMNKEAVADGTEIARYNYSDAEIGPGFFNEGTNTSQSPVGVHLYGDSTVNSTSKNSAAVLEVLQRNELDLEATAAELKGTAYQGYYEALRRETEGFGQDFAMLSKLLNLKMLGENISSGRIKHVMTSTDYTNAGVQAMKDYQKSLEEMEKEYFHAIVRGERPLDDWDQFIASWKAQGGQDILDQINKYWSKEP